MSEDFAKRLEGFFATTWHDYIIRYFTVPPLPKGTRLRVGNWIGWMESGKSHGDGVMEAKLKLVTRGRRLYVVTNSVVHAAYELLFNRRDELLDADYIDIFFDDSIVMAHAHSRRDVKVATDKVISVFRHIFNAALQRPAVITLRVAAQRYMTMHTLLKGAPVLIIKSIPNDPGDYYAISRLFKSGKRAYFDLLKKLTAAAYIDDRWKEYAIAVVAGRAKIVRISGSPAPPDIRITASVKTPPEEFAELAAALLDLAIA